MSPSRRRPGAGNAVADDVVDRCAQELRVAAIVERCGQRVARQNEIERYVVELLCRYARLHIFGDHVERLGGKLPGAAHALESIGAVNPDLGGRRCGGAFDKCHLALGLSRGLA